MTNSGIDDEVTPEQHDRRGPTGRSRRLRGVQARRRCDRDRDAGGRARRAWPTGRSPPASCGRTGWPVTNESPKSRVTTPIIASTYWTMIGRSVPSFWLSASTLSWGANGPRIVRPTSFGSTLAMTNTIVASSHSVMSASSSAARDEPCHRLPQPVTVVCDAGSTARPATLRRASSGGSCWSKRRTSARERSCRRPLNFFELPAEVVVEVRDGRSATSSSRIVSILVQAAFWASTPTAVWKSVNACVERRRRVLRRVPDALRS